MADESEPKPRGLWDVMRQQGESVSAEPPRDEPAASVADEEFEEAEPQEGESAAPQKSLWALMGVSSPVPDVSEPKPAEEEAAPPPAWFRGKIEDQPPTASEQPSAVAEDEDEDIFEEAPAAEPDEVEREQEELDEESEPAVSPPAKPAAFVVADSPARERLANIAVKTGRSRGAMLSLLVGLLAVPLTLLASMPEVWTRIPPAILGFGALVRRVDFL